MENKYIQEENNEKEIITEETNNKSGESTEALEKNQFNGYFHGRDRLAENNIVNEVETSFLEYSMSVIASSLFIEEFYGQCMNLVILQKNLIESLLLLLDMLWGIIIHMGIHQFMKQWLEWHKTLIRDIY